MWLSVSQYGHDWWRRYHDGVKTIIAGTFGLLFWGTIGYGVYRYASAETPLDPPGWDCYEDSDDDDHTTTRCYPADGYHFELNNQDDKIAVHNILPNEEERQKELDLANGWNLLNNKERQAILDGRATIYDYVEFKEGDK